MPDDCRPLAFSPGSITCFFHVQRDAKPEATVSCGCAINISAGVTAGLAEALSTSVKLNGQPLSLPTVDCMVERLAPAPLRIELETPLSIGCGFGVSAAAALSVAFAINRFFELGQSREQLGLLAHVAEVECGTGVGDVAAQLYGGVVYRRCQEGPFDCERLDVPDSPLSYVVFGPLSTKETLKSVATVRAISREGKAACQWMEENTRADLPEILKRSRQFSEGVGLLTDQVRGAIADAAACEQEATMILLGQSVVAAGLRPPNPNWTATQLDIQGTRIIE